MILFLHGTTA